MWSSPTSLTSNGGRVIFSHRILTMPHQCVNSARSTRQNAAPRAWRPCGTIVPTQCRQPMRTSCSRMSSSQLRGTAPMIVPRVPSQLSMWLRRCRPLAMNTASGPKTPWRRRSFCWHLQLPPRRRMMMRPRWRAHCHRSGLLPISLPTSRCQSCPRIMTSISWTMATAATPRSAVGAVMSAATWRRRRQSPHCHRRRTLQLV